MHVLSLTSDKLKGFERPVLTVGTFDGVHLAHIAILEKVVERARSEAGTSLVVTFEPHPQALLHPQTAPPLLTTEGEKIEMFSALGLDVLVVLPFTKQLAQMEAREFAKKILHEKLKAWRVIIGHDHTFGRDRQGRLETLEEMGCCLGFKVEAVEPILCRGVPISSTRIRSKLLAGQVREAAEMLGRPYNLAGRIVPGDGRGRFLNYPTANMEVNSEKLIPANGVYAVVSDFTVPALRGLLNVGVSPTFGGTTRRLEIHFFDFQKSLYGQELNIKLIEKIRDEERFEDGARLSEQIRKDEEVARRLLAPD